MKFDSLTLSRIYLFNLLKIKFNVLKTLTIFAKLFLFFNTSADLFTRTCQLLSFVIKKDNSYFNSENTFNLNQTGWIKFNRWISGAKNILPLQNRHFLKIKGFRDRPIFNKIHAEYLIVPVTQERSYFFALDVVATSIRHGH